MACRVCARLVPLRTRLLTVLPLPSLNLLFCPPTLCFLQLFSIGLWELNSDGTPKIDPSTGQYINAYTNEDIMAFARVWTGWDLQPNRGNIMSFDDFDHRIVNLIGEFAVLLPNFSSSPPSSSGLI